MIFRHFQFRAAILFQLVLATVFASSLFGQASGPVWILVGNPTHTSAKSGPWSDASTWKEGTVPGAGSNVSISANHTVTGAAGKTAFIMVHRGATLELGDDLEVSSLLWVRSAATLNIGSHTLTGGTLRLGWTSENANLVRDTGGKIRTKNWDHFRTNQTMDKLDRVDNLYLSNFNGAVTTFTTTSRFNVNGSVWVERGGTSGTTTLELGDDLDLSGDFSMREGFIKDNGYNVTVGGQITNGNSKLWGWNGMKTIRGGGNLIARKLVFGRGVDNVSFRSCDIVLEQFATVNRFTTTTNFSIDQDAINSARSGSGLTIENPADDAFVLGYRDGARDRTVITLNWDNTLSSGFDWIFRWKGNHVEQLKEYIQDGKLVAGSRPAGTTFTANDNVYYDAGKVLSEQAYTYIGIPGSEPEPSVTIPALDPGGDVRLTEGPTDYPRYARPEGPVKAVMIFVDFPDAQSGSRTTEFVANHLLGDGRAQRLYQLQSYGNMTLDITRIDRWETMSKNAGEYTNSDNEFEDGYTHKEYVAEAVGKFQDVDFSLYDIVYIVAEKTEAIGLSPTFNSGIGQEIETQYAYTDENNNQQTKPGKVRHAVTFGNDSYKLRFTTLVHETGHIFGLPDLYGAEMRVGTWDIMANNKLARYFLGWHRHKMGWFDRQRKTYLSTSGTHEIDLTRLSSCCGTSMAVIPVGTAAEPSKVFVVELTEPILTANILGPGSWEAEPFHSEGVLIYSVDATIAQNNQPVKIYSKNTKPASPQGDERFLWLWNAPYTTGDTFTNSEAPMTVEVLEKIGTGPNSSYKVKITVNSQATAND